MPGPADEVADGALGRTVELNFGEARQQFLPNNTHLYPRQMLAKAYMRPVAKDRLAIGFPVQPERERFVKLDFVAIGQRAGR